MCWKNHASSADSNNHAPTARQLRTLKSVIAALCNGEPNDEWEKSTEVTLAGMCDSFNFRFVSARTISFLHSLIQSQLVPAASFPAARHRPHHMSVWVAVGEAVVGLLSLVLMIKYLKVEHVE